MGFKKGDRVIVIHDGTDSDFGEFRYRIGWKGTWGERNECTFDNGYSIKSGCMQSNFEILKEEHKMDFKVGQKVTVVGQQYPEMDSIGYTEVITKVDQYWSRPYILDNDYSYNADELKEVKGMDKSELKDNMLVQIRTGEWGIISSLVYGKRGIVFMDELKSDLDCYQNDMKACSGNDEYDIIAVATFSYLGDFLRVYRGKKTIENLMGFKVIWTRENHKKQQLTQLVDKLQKQLKEATDELEAM